MAKVLNRKQLVSEIKELICNATEYIYLICPYIELEKDSIFMTSIEEANNKKIDITIIYSKGFKKKAGQERLKKFKSVKLCYISDLHMKVYLNDKSAIVCSLNLVDFSIKNNLECGIIMNREEDLWKEVYTMIKSDIYNNMIIEKKREQYTWKKK